MEQTLVCEETQTLISRIAKLTVFDQFAQTLFVEHNHGVIEVEKSYKEAHSLKFIRTEIAYNLKNHRIISKKINNSHILISDLTEGSTISIDKSICRCVSSDLNKLFTQELDEFKDIERFEFNLFSQNFFKKTFYPNTNNDLINKFIEVSKHMTWAIIPYNLVSVFYESDKMELCKELNEKIIYRLGKIENIEVYVNPNEENGKIYFGNYDSILILANKFINIEENTQGVNYNFEYLFLEQGKIKTLQVI
jgi:hypothetical protein